jgi:hypothetical protein
MTKVPEWDMVPLEPLGGTTRCLEASPPEEEVRRRLSVVRSQYYPGLQDFQVRETPDRAMRKLLNLCGKQEIPVALVLTPECSEFRAWYPPQTSVVLRRYCEMLTRDYGVTVVDAREWLPDCAFSDGHHALPDWATRFTRRLGKEVLQPLVEGRWGGHGTDVARKP